MLRRKKSPTLPLHISRFTVAFIKQISESLNKMFQEEFNKTKLKDWLLESVHHGVCTVQAGEIAKYYILCVELKAMNDENSLIKFNI